MIREHRLIGITLDALNRQRQLAGVKTPVVPQNARSIEAITTLQKAQNVQRGLAPTATTVGTPGVDVTTPYVRQTVDTTGADKLLSERNTVLANAQRGAPTVMNQQLNDAGGKDQTFRTAYVDPRNPTGFVPEGANVGDARFDTTAARSAERGAQRDPSVQLLPDQVKKAKDAEYQAKRNDILTKASTEAADAHASGSPATDIYAKYNAELAALDSQKTQEEAQQKQDQMNLTQADKPQTPNAVHPMESILPQTQSIGTINQLLQAVQGDPSIAAAYMPTISSLQSRAQLLEQQRSLTIQNAQADPAFLGMLASDLTFQQQAFEQGRVIAEKDKQLQVDAANEVKNIMDLQEQRDQMGRTREETTLRQQQQEAEIRNRRLVNATGMDTDSQGLQFLESERTKGEQLLRDLQEEHRLDAAISNATIAMTYKSATENAIATYNSKDLQLQSQYQSAKKEIMDTFNMDKKDRKEAIQKALDTYFTGMGKVDEDYAGMLKDARTEAEKSRVQANRDLWDRQDKLYDRLQDHLTNYGNTNPQGLTGLTQQMRQIGMNTSFVDSAVQTIEQQKLQFSQGMDNAKLQIDLMRLGNEQRRLTLDEQSKSGGKPLLSSQVREITKYDDAIGNLVNAAAKIFEFKDVGGPISGRLGAFPGSELLPGPGMDQKKLRASLDRVKQLVGKAMEDGVLRKEDEAKYEKMLPNITDTDEIRKYKIEELKSNIIMGRNNLLRNLSLNGQDISGFDAGDPLAPATPGALPNEDADAIMKSIESGEPLSQSASTGFLDALAQAHQQHEGYGTANAVTITEGNNPGALKYLPSMAKYGAKPGKNNFAMFPDYHSGHKALVADLRAKITGGSSHIDYSKSPTLQDYVAVYAPSGDGNNPSGYARSLVAKLRSAGYDVNVNTPLSQLASLVG